MISITQWQLFFPVFTLKGKRYRARARFTGLWRWPQRAIDTYPDTPNFRAVRSFAGPFLLTVLIDGGVAR